LAALPELIDTPPLVTGPLPELCVTVADDAPLLNVVTASAAVLLAPMTAAHEAHGAAARRNPRLHVVCRFMIFQPASVRHSPKPLQVEVIARPEAYSM
jgi:hypothetical protein